MGSESGDRKRAESIESGPQRSLKHPKELNATPRPSRGYTRVVRVSQPISTDGIKALVSSHLPPGHHLREAILAEREKLEPEEFLAKMETWLILLNQSNRTLR